MEKKFEIILKDENLRYFLEIQLYESIHNLAIGEEELLNKLINLWLKAHRDHLKRVEDERRAREQEREDVRLSLAAIKRDLEKEANRKLDIEDRIWVKQQMKRKPK